MGEIIYNGRSTAEFGIKVWSAPNYELSERDDDIYHVPGRNGDLVVSHGSFKNVERAYTVSSGYDGANFFTLARQIEDWMSSSSSYAVLQDTYDPQYYRIALPPKVAEITNLLGQAALASITFNCKPQRFLVAGDTKQTISSFSPTPSITNPTKYDARPILYFYGTNNASGGLTINGYPISISSLKGTSTAVVIDCLLQECYVSGSMADASAIVTMPNGFPVLKSGSNSFTSKTGSLTKLEVQPKWWTR